MASTTKKVKTIETDERLEPPSSPRTPSNRVGRFCPAWRPWRFDSSVPPPACRCGGQPGQRHLKLAVSHSSRERNSRLTKAWGGSSVGRALRSQCRGRGFDSLPLHLFHPHRDDGCSAAFFAVSGQNERPTRTSSARPPKRMSCPAPQAKRVAVPEARMRRHSSDGPSSPNSRTRRVQSPESSV